MTSQQLLKIAKDFGGPFIFMTLKNKRPIQKLEIAFKSVKNLSINYAAKALSNVNILKYLNNLGAGLDTVSFQEVELGLKAGFDPKDIIFTPNGVSIDEIEKVVSYGAQINIDNLAMLEQFGNKHPSVPVCIRINPHVMAGGNNNISVGHIDSKFGISIHQIPHLIRIVENTKMNIMVFICTLEVIFWI